MVRYSNIGIFQFVYSLFSLTYTVSNVNIDIPMIKQESSWQRVSYYLEVGISSFINLVDL